MILRGSLWHCGGRVNCNEIVFVDQDMLNLQFISQWLNGVAALEISTGLAPWLVILAVMVYGLVHSWLASLGFKARTHRWLGSFSERVYRLAYNIFAGLTLLPGYRESMFGILGVAEKKSRPGSSLAEGLTRYKGET